MLASLKTRQPTLVPAYPRIGEESNNELRFKPACKDRAGLICSNKLSHLELQNSARELPLLQRTRAGHTHCAHQVRTKRAIKTAQRAKLAVPPNQQ